MASILCGLTILPIVLSPGAFDNLRTTTRFVSLAQPATGIKKIDANSDGRDDMLAVYSGPCGYEVFLADAEGDLVAQGFNELSTFQIPPFDAADLDGDGLEDLAVYTSLTQSIQVFRNSGQGTFDEDIWQSIPITQGVQRVFIADADGDSLKDILVLNGGTQAVSFGDGQGTFTDPVPFLEPAAGSGLSVMAAADILGTGTPQVIVLSNQDLYLFSVVERVVQRQRVIRLPFRGVAIGIDDADLDGREDAVIPLGGRLEAMVVGFRSPDDEPTVYSPLPGTENQTINSAAFGDLSGNGVIDIVPGFAGDAPLAQLYWTTSPPNFYRQTQPAIGVFSEMASPVILDTDGDGAKEIAYYGQNPDGILVLRPGVFGTFLGIAGSHTMPSRAEGFAVWRSPDASERLIAPTFGAGIQDIRIQPGPVVGFEVDSLEIPSVFGLLRSPFAIGDVNGDGLEDVVSLRDDGGTSLFVWKLAQPDGSFGVSISRPADPRGFSTDGIAVADFNNDGLADAATLQGSSGSVSISPGRASGLLAAPYQVQVSDALLTSLLVARDIDFDGNVDLICGLSGQARLLISYGLGDGTFEPAVRVEIPISSLGSSRGMGSSRAIDFGFINPDPYLDIVIGVSFGSAVLLSNGPRSFDEPIRASTGPNGKDVRAIDFDADGIVDVATTFRGYTEVAGIGPQGYFSNKGRFYSGQINHDDVRYDDIDGDGLPDFVGLSRANVIVIPNTSMAPCRVDFLPDEELNLFDIAGFLSAFADKNPGADFDWNGRHDFFDVAVFLNLFMTGCQ